MRRSGVGSGGGYRMNKQVDSRAPKVEPKAHRINESATNYLGNRTGDHVTNKNSTGWRAGPLYGGKGYEPPGMISDPVKAVGVAGGRRVMPSGGQGTHGPVAPGNAPAKNHDILRDFGPDSRK